MNRIEKKFRALKKRKSKALIVFMTAGDPSLRKNEELIYAFEKEGVDLIELGVPFSDPLADGVVIQAASERALKKKTDLRQILSVVKKVRLKSQIPLVLMSYLNPILAFGLERFARAAREAGVDGLIVPDLPVEEGKAVSEAMAAQSLDLIYLLAPTSTPERRKHIARHSRGFVYYVSLTGVTGVRKNIPDLIHQNILSAKKATRLPVCAGFGISTPQQAREIAKTADGVIVGSAVVGELAKNQKANAAALAHRLIHPFARALGKETV
jgi:tryptophan synthase alpha chain